MYTKNLTLENFKGLSINIDFTDKDTFIHGINTSGKTRIVDAWLWLFTGKDSQGLCDSGKGSKFEPFPTDNNGNVIHDSMPKVTAILDNNGDEISVKKWIVEEWNKEKTQITGRTVKYFWNVACTATEFESKLNNIISMEKFKLLSDPIYFNSLPWEKKREIIVGLVGFLENDKEIMSFDPKFSDLITSTKNKTITEYRKEIKDSITETNKELTGIPFSIKENQDRIPESEPDYVQLEIEKEGIVALISNIDTSLQDSSKGTDQTISELQKINATKLDLSSKISNKEYEASRQNLEKLNVRKTEKDTIEASIKNIVEKEIPAMRANIYGLNREKTQLEEENKQLRVKYSTEWSKEFSFNIDSICPTCQRPFTTAEIEEKKNLMLLSFNQAKQKNLDEIQAKGQSNNKRIKSNNPDDITIETQIADIESEIEQASKIKASKESELQSLSFSPVGVESSQAILAKDNEYSKLKTELLIVQSKIDELNKPVEKINNSEKIQKKAELNRQLDVIKLQIANKDIIQGYRNRISQLEKERTNIGNRISQLEKIKTNIEDFIQFKISFVNKKVVDVFPAVRFCMFKMQMNGEIDNNVCDTLHNGIGWLNMSASERINVGMEIISVMQAKWGVIIPIFIDNRESVTNLFQTEAQTVNLVVDSTCKVLTIKS